MSDQTMMIGQQTTLSTGAVVAAYRVGDDRTLFRFQSAGSETAVALTDEAVGALMKLHKGVSEWGSQLAAAGLEWEVVEA